MQEIPRSRRAALTGMGAASAALFGVALSRGEAFADSPSASPSPSPSAGASYDPSHGAGNQGRPGLGHGADVRLLGAAGDGTTDDTDAFVRAFAMAAEDGSRLVVVPAGTYRITAPLTVTAPVNLTGLAGWAGSVIRFEGQPANGLTVNPASSQGIYPGPAIEITGLSFDYSGPGAAVLIDESGVHSPFHDTRITACRFHVHAGTGYSSVNQRSIIVAHNQFLGSSAKSGTGIALNDSDNTMITDNVFYNIGYGIHGIRGPVRVFNAGCTVLGNSMSGSQKSLFFENWESIQATGNMLDGAAVNPVHLVDCYNSVFSNNYLGPTGTGPALLVESSQPRGNRGQIAFTTNYVNYYQGTAGSAAISLHGVDAANPVDQVTLANNILNNHPPVGIRLENARNVLITGNTLSRAGSLSDASVQAVLDVTPGTNHILQNIVDAPVTGSGDTIRDNFTRVPVS